MKHLAYGFVLIIQFFTRIPLPIQCPLNEKNWKWALRFFPMVGLIIGGCLMALFKLFYPVLPAYFIVPLLLTVWVFLTGGLHLDGWMDFADAIGSNAPLEKKREIMKDSRVGTFAILALFFILVWKGIFLNTLINSQSLLSLALLYIPMVARFQGLLILYFFKPYQSKGLAVTLKRYLQKKDILIAFTLLIPFLLFEYMLIIVFVLQFCMTVLFGKWAVKHLDGINGDVVGASIEGAELWNLMIFSIYILFVTA